jgi:hypothetical protein
LNKKYNENYKLLKEKNDEVEFLRKRVADLEKNIESSSTQHTKQKFDENPSSINILSTNSYEKKDDYQESITTTKTDHNKNIMGNYQTYINFFLYRHK